MTAYLPELGTLDRRHAALVGVAPFNRDSHAAGQTHRMGRTPGPRYPVHGSVGSQPPQPRNPFYRRLGRW